MEIKHFNDGKKGHFIALDNESEAGKITFTFAGTNKIIIDHTEVNDNYRGKNIGKTILNYIIQHSRDNGIKILPLCPFAKSVFDKTPDWSDVLF